MRKAIIQFVSNSLHFAVALEILKQEKDLNNEMHLYIWGTQTKYPGRASVGFETISGFPPRNYRHLIMHANHLTVYKNKMNYDAKWVRKELKILKNQILKYDSMEQLTELNLQGINPCPALINEISTLTKDINFSVVNNDKLIGFLLESYLQVYNATCQLINLSKIEKIYVYNGRFFHERAVWDAAKSLGVEVEIFETIRDRYILMTEGFHNRIHNQKIMIDLWQKSILSEEEKINVGSQFYDELRSKDNPFIIDSKNGFEIDKPFFVYFSSSDDEYIGLGSEWKRNLGNQLNCVKELQRVFDSQNEYKLVIRLHPNLLNKSYKQKYEWSLLKNSISSRIVYADQRISSYDLLDKSMGSITFGSTMGLESAFAKKPTLLLADSNYDLLGVADKANDWKYVIEWIKKGFLLSEDELLKRKNNSCIRGYYLANGGINFKHTQLKQIGFGAWIALYFDKVKVPNINRLAIVRKLKSKWKFFKVIRMVNNGK